MKRLICLILALAMTLCACAGVPEETNTPPETTVPVETTAPAETAVPVETTAPAETAVPAETTAPIETTAPASSGYTLRIEDPETPIYTAPAFRHGIAALIGEAGAYTIVEEVTDSDGNRWGKLKSGAGWVCLTSPALAPIYADYAPEDFNAYHAYWCEDTDYITAIGFTASQKLTDVRFGLLDWFETESWQMAEVLYTMDEMDADHAFLAQVVFWGDMTTYGIAFTDEHGEDRCFAVSISGKDGSLICTEYVPE